MDFRQPELPLNHPIRMFNLRPAKGYGTDDSISKISRRVRLRIRAAEPAVGDLNEGALIEFGN